MAKWDLDKVVEQQTERLRIAVERAGRAENERDALAEQLDAARADAKEAEAYADALAEQLEAARADAKEAEAYAEELEARVAELTPAQEKAPAP